MKMKLLDKAAIISLVCSAALLPTAAAFDYEVTDASISLTDIETTIGGLSTIFTNQEMAVTASGLGWSPKDSVEGSTNILKCETLLDGEPVSSGELSLDGLGRELPTDVDCGTLTVTKGGRVAIEVVLSVDDSSASFDSEYESFGSGVSILPLVVILFLAMTTKMVEFSLFSGILVGACIIAGDLKSGFMATLDTYLVNAVADGGHAFVVLFTLFLSGLVAMMEKSGGMYGFTKDVSTFATTSRSGQLACFGVGILVFFDDYANCLLAGKTMRPLLDALFVSREKLAFIVDATAAPIASISPVSSWVGFEVGLIQDEIDKIIDMEGTEDIGIKTSGFSVFLESIKYRYYPIFMLVLILLLITTQRDFGSMLVAERKTQVYKRTDGGDGASEKKKKIGDSETEAFSSDNEPRKDTPRASWNMIVPIIIYVFFIFLILVRSGDDGSGEQSFMDKIESSDSYVALLYGTMAGAIVALLFYLLQIVKDGKFIFPSPQALKEACTCCPEDSEKARFLMSVRESTDSFVLGFTRVFPALIVLNLAWATGDVMGTVGADRLFARWIFGITPEALPTLSFLISLLMALATGTSWGTMSILFPLVLVPTYTASNGDAEIFYAVVAGVLSGSVAGDHISPISDTTVLSSLAADCNHLAHVGTQAPYAVVVVIVSVLLGTLPIGFGAWPNIIGILLGAALLVAFAFLVCAPVLSSTGKYDILTELYISIFKSEGLIALKEDTAKACNGETEALIPAEKELSEDDAPSSVSEAAA